ncbi:ABC transporter permease [Rhizohabitans arisaemae]|uniref:ABC transporter permease n=1 Tax=Rhizohabitans arisaemae TaxID=2720610 RepID=UPI0024B27A80|nr:ABC transporter permease [Rhizohabitans arisaemae]
MSALLRLNVRLLRGGGRGGLLGSGLTLVAVAVATTLLLFSVSVNVAFADRAARETWRNPAPAESGARVIQAVGTEFAGGKPIVVVDLAALDPGAPAPPGLPRFPRPGEVWLSSALAELAAELPADRLAARFPGERAGTVGDDALIHPDELVAVLGHRPGAPAVTAERPPGPDLTSVSPTPIKDFAGTETRLAVNYRILAAVAAVLMIVPLLVFGGAAARLTVARRDARLAALRLVGATPGQVVGMTVAEAVVTALAGSAVGTVLYTVAIPVLARIEIAGGGWYAADLWPGIPIVAAVLFAVPLLVGLSAAIGLRQVVVSPLGVARRHTPPALRVIRVLAFVTALLVVPFMSPEVGVGVILTVIGLVFLAINLVGPWVVALIGRITAAVARRPAGLLAARRLVDDPRSAWRTVSGVALTGFVAGFVSLLSPDPSAFTRDTPGDRLELTVPAAQAAGTADAARRRLAQAGVRATVTAEDTRLQGADRVATVVATVSGGGDEALDRGRTALRDLVPGQPPQASRDRDAQAVSLFTDIRTGTVVVLAVSFLVAVAGAGITAASTILDRRRTYALLRLAGTPLEVLDRARRSETMIPLTIMGGGAILTGLFVAAPFATQVGLNPGGLVTLAICVSLGVAGVIGAGALTRPLLKSVTENPAPRPD